ncbi:MAG: RNA methyltransferase [Chlorobi bacterium]|nr:RNA methyltransferase [Chlorobiota bacterium]
MRKLKMEELGRLDPAAFKKAPKFPLIVVADNLRSLHNVGSLFRTADAFRVEKIYLTGFTATPPHREIHKTALGATESVDWEYAEDVGALLENLKKEGVFILAAEQTDESVPLQDFCPPRGRKVAVVFGNEVEGVSDRALQRADAAVEIPQFGTKHSFNVSVSAGIVLWDLLAKMKFYPLCER